jgi:hypothetical protein
MFNEKVDKLPQNITHLTFGYRFNQKVDNLPQNITHLTFGDCFNQKINNLPFTLKEININNKKLLERIPFGCQINIMSHTVKFEKLKN